MGEAHLALMPASRGPRDPWLTVAESSYGRLRNCQQLLAAIFAATSAHIAHQGSDFAAELHPSSLPLEPYISSVQLRISAMQLSIVHMPEALLSEAQCLLTKLEEVATIVEDVVNELVHVLTII